MKKLHLVGILLLSLASTSQAAEWVGSPAPAFKLPDQHGVVHQLADYRGHWLALYFYPKDHTSGCTEEAKQFRQWYPQFKQQNIQVVGVSLDSTDSHQQFAKDLQLPFTLLSDPEGVLAKPLGVLQGFGPIKYTSRETFLIDPEGTVIYHYKDVNPSRHAQQILADIAQLQKK